MIYAQLPAEASREKMSVAAAFAFRENNKISETALAAAETHIPAINAFFAALLYEYSFANRNKTGTAKDKITLAAPNMIANILSAAAPSTVIECSTSERKERKISPPTATA